MKPRSKPTTKRGKGMDVWTSNEKKAVRNDCNYRNGIMDEANHVQSVLVNPGEYNKNVELFIGRINPGMLEGAHP